MTDRAKRWVATLLGGRPGPVAESGAEPAEVERLLAFHGLEGLAFAAHRRDPVLSPGMARRLEPAYRRTALSTALVVEAAESARETLIRAGVESLLFKGAALVADGTWDDPGARAMDDADLLVRQGGAERAVEALLAAGWRPWEPWRPDRPRWVDSLTLDAPDAPPGMPAVLDLHWRIAYGRLRFGAASPDGPWDGASRRGTPAPEPHLVLVAEHLLKHLRWRVHLRAYADLARLATRVDDWDRVARAVAGSRFRVALTELLASVRDDLGVPGIPGGLFPGPGKGGRGMLRGPTELVGRRSPVDGRLAGLMLRWRLLGSFRAAVADGVQAAFPPRRWLEARYGEAAGSTLALRVRYLRDALRWVSGRGPSPVSPNQGSTPFDEGDGAPAGR